MSAPSHPPNSYTCANCGTQWEGAQLICPNCGAPWAGSARSASVLRATFKVFATVCLVISAVLTGASGACFVFFNFDQPSGPYYSPSREAGYFGLALLVVSGTSAWLIFRIYRRRAK